MFSKSVTDSDQCWAPDPAISEFQDGVGNWELLNLNGLTWKRKSGRKQGRSLSSFNLLHCSTAEFSVFRILTDQKGTE